MEVFNINFSPSPTRLLKAGLQMLLSIYQNELNYTVKYFVRFLSCFLMVEVSIAFLRILL